MIRNTIFASIAFFGLILQTYAFQERDLDFLEQSRYDSVFSDESFGERLNRLENDILGMSQTGDPDSRIEKLMRINENRINYPPTVYDEENYSGSKQNPVKKFFGNLTEYFTDNGALTGFTPGYYSYSPGYSSYGTTSHYPYYSNGSVLSGNAPSYCNFYERPHYGYKRPYRQHYINDSSSIRKKLKHGLKNEYYNHPNRYPGYGNPVPYYSNGYYNPYYKPIYSPSDVITRSAVHILTD